MKKFISAFAVMLAVSLAGLAYYCAHNDVRGRLGIIDAAALTAGNTAAAETVTDVPATAEPTNQATTTQAVTVTTTKPTTEPTEKPTTRRIVTTVIKTTLTTLKDTGRTETKTSKYSENLNYGVTASVTEYKYYKIMEDGTSVYDRTTKSYVYDRSGYSATIEELKPEAYRNMDTYSSERAEILRIVNGYRDEVDLSDLTVNSTLTRAASVRAVEIAWSDKHNHTRPDGTRWSTLFKDFGITTGKAGENIGWGYETPKEVCKGWRDSYSHYENIVNGDFTQTGVGVAAGPDGKLYWVQLFSS